MLELFDHLLDVGGSVSVGGNLSAVLQYAKFTLGLCAKKQHNLMGRISNQ